MAARVRDVVWAQSGRLDTFSERGRMVPELNDPAIREVFVFRYRLLYAVADTRVTIVAFLHGARDFEAWRRSQDEG